MKRQLGGIPLRTAMSWPKRIVIFIALVAGTAAAQTTLNRQPLWFAATGDCNHALFNNITEPCGQISPTGSDDSEYLDYYSGLVFQPRVSGPPSYFTSNGNMIFQGSVGIGTTNTNSHRMMVRDVGTNGIVWSMAVNNPINMQGSSAPGVGIKLSLSQEEIGYNEVNKWDGILAYTEPGSEYGNAMGLALYTNQGPDGSETPTEKMRISAGGNVGIGTTSPGAKLEVNGNMKLTAGSGASITFADGTVQSTAYTGVTCGGDYAESVNVTGDRTNYEPGDLLVIDPSAPGKFLKSAEPYSTSVTGIYSTKPGVVGRRQTTGKSPDEVPMAMVGIVPTKVSAENGPIRPGDLLVTASTLGYAMKGTDHSRMLGAVVGKALGSLDSGTGVIEVVVTLQ